MDKSLFCSEEEVTLTTEVTKVAFPYGLQFVVSYDPELVEAESRWVTSLFDVDGDGVVPDGRDAQCADGLCRFARSQTGDDPVSGYGTEVEIDGETGAGAWSI